MPNIEVAYATPSCYKILSLDVVEGTTIEEAILQSAIQAHFPEIDLNRQRVGVFGELRVLSDVIKAGDRIEIYRPLSHDPMVARKQRVKQARILKQRQRQQSRQVKDRS